MVMSLIESLTRIKNAVYGREVREAIHDGVFRANQIADNAVSTADHTQIRQDDLEAYNEQMIQEMTDKDVISAPEIIESRDGEDNLGIRLARDKNIIEDQISNLSDGMTDVALTVDKLDSRHLYFDGSESLESVINQATAQRKSIRIPSGTYIIDDTIVANLGGIDLTIIGEGSTEGIPNTRLLWRGGAKTMFKLTGVRYFNLKDIEVSAYLEGDDVKVTVGSTGFDITGSLRATNSNIMGFGTILKWRGGYYHKFINCELRFFTLGFDSVDCYNFNFSNCRILDFGRLISIASGVGPLNFFQTSIERWTNNAIYCMGEARPVINFSGVYVENYPNEPVAEGLTGVHNSNFCVGGGIINVTGSGIVTSGIKRFIHANEHTRMIISKGNRISYRKTDSNLEHYIWNPATVAIVETLDFATDGNLIQAGGTYVPTYFSHPTAANATQPNVTAYDAFAKVFK